MGNNQIDRSFKEFADYLYKSNDVVNCETIIENFIKSFEADKLKSYKNLFEEIKKHYLFNSIEHHNLKVSALSHCIFNMKHILIETKLANEEYTDLRSLTKNNEEYENLINQYQAKIKNVELFLNREEFIQEEKDRIKTIFIKPFVGFPVIQPVHLELATMYC